jgi:hypothetical protein
MIAERGLFTSCETRFRLLEVTADAQALLAGDATAVKTVAHVLRMDDAKALPQQWSVKEMKDGLADGTYVDLKSRARKINLTPRGNSAKSDASLKVQRKRTRIIEPLVKNPLIYLREHRGQLVAARAKEMNVSENTILTCLRLYWAGGKTFDALRGGYHRSGIEREPDDNKVVAVRGRRPANDDYTKFRWKPDIKLKVIKLVKQLLKKETNTDDFIYRQVLLKFFSTPDTSGKVVPLPLGQRPSRRQVWYLRKKNTTLEDALRRIHGDDGFENNVKPMVGSARLYAGNIAQYFEIDSTKVDVEICADSDEATVIGKATLYLIVDARTRLIVGFHLTLDPPSWMGAMEAMLSLVEDKRELCERWDFEYREEDWPAHGAWPQFFRADCGSEFKGYDSDAIPEGLEGALINVPPRKAPRKGAVELSFKLINVSLKDYIAGYTPPKEFGKRQTVDRKKEATRTLKSVGREILEAIRLRNHLVIRRLDRKLDRKLTGPDFLATPANLWKLDFEHFGDPGGPDADFARFKLMPQEKMTLTRHGVSHHDLRWVPSPELRQQWLLPAAAGGQRDVYVTFDRRRVDVIYVHDAKHPDRWTTMHLTEENSAFVGMSWPQYIADREMYRKTNRKAEEHNLGGALNLDLAAQQRAKADAAKQKAALARSGGKAPATGGVELRERQQTADRLKTTVLESTTVVDAAGSASAPMPQRPSNTKPPNETAAEPSRALDVAQTAANAALNALLDF